MGSKKLRTCISLLLSISLVFSSIPCNAYASSTFKENDSSIKVQQLSLNTYEITQDNQTSTIAIDDSRQYRTVTVTNASSGEQSFFSYNKKNNTVYSSITGQTISLEELETDTDEAGYAYAVRKASGKISYKYISYRTVRNAVGFASGAATVLSFFLSFIPGAQAAAGISGRISAILSLIQNTIPDQSNHGFKLTLKSKTTKYIRHGKPVYLTSDVIINVTQY